MGCLGIMRVGACARQYTLRSRTSYIVPFLSTLYRKEIVMPKPEIVHCQARLYFKVEDGKQADYMDLFQEVLRQETGVEVHIEEEDMPDTVNE